MTPGYQGLGVHDVDALFEEADGLRLSGSDVEGFEADEEGVRFTDRRGVGDLVRVQADQPAAAGAYPGPGRVPVAHDDDLVDVLVDDVCVLGLEDAAAC